MGFSGQEYWSGPPCPPPGNLPNPGIKSTSLTPSALAGGSLPLVPPGKPKQMGLYQTKTGKALVMASRFVELLEA